jgi:hypothetical protein
MVAIQYHKGQPCVYSSVFCQEGFCSECEICQNWNLKLHENLTQAGAGLRARTTTKKPELAASLK